MKIEHIELNEKYDNYCIIEKTLKGIDKFRRSKKIVR